MLWRNLPAVPQQELNKQHMSCKNVKEHTLDFVWLYPLAHILIAQTHWNICGGHCHTLEWYNPWLFQTKYTMFPPTHITQKFLYCTKVSKYTLSWRMYLMFNLFTTPQIFRSVHLPSHWGCWGCPHGPPRWISRSHPFPWSDLIPHILQIKTDNTALKL